MLVALLVMIIRKMIKNKWLELSLLLGLVLSVALISSMPIYTESILQRMLVSDLYNHQQESDEYSGLYSTAIQFPEGFNMQERSELIAAADEYIEKTVAPGLSLPIDYYVVERATDSFILSSANPDIVDPSYRKSGTVASMTRLEEHIELIDGRLPAKEAVDGIYEVIVTEAAMDHFEMVLGYELLVNIRNFSSDIVVKPVGIFRPAEGHDLYFNKNRMSAFETRLFIDSDIFDKVFIHERKVPIRSSYWQFSLDYSNMSLSDVVSFVNTGRNHQIFTSERFESYVHNAPMLKVLDPYLEREKRLRTMLWSLNVPVIIMLSFYLFMVSNLIINRQKTEISVLRSRGASRLQIMFMFALEGMLLGAIAFFTGPHLGALLTRMLGASSGFLEFVQRAPLIVKMTPESYQYALITVICSIIMTLIPAFIATRETIVGHKRKMARASNKSFWHKYYIDIILIASSIYGLNNFYRTLEDMKMMGIDALNFRIDPLLFLIPALFILGLGLFILRIYPWLVALLYWIGRKWWSATMYSSLIQVSRSSTQYQYIMIFLTMTIATGLFSASAARTLNKNMEDQIMYAAGSDVVMEVRWQSDAPVSSAPPEPGQGGSQSDSSSNTNRVVRYTEPPFSLVSDLPGVEHAAKVFIKDEVRYSTLIENGTAKLMAIDTDDFGKTAWFKQGLLGQHHINSYLNLIAEDPTAVLISRSLAEEKGVEKGDVIQIGWPGIPEKPFVVYEVIDYFPTFNPNPDLSTSQGGQAPLPKLIVAHLDRVQNQLALEPYQVWLKLAEDASRQEIIDVLEERRVPIIELHDTLADITKEKNDPFQLAVNGVMTLGFIISVVISFFGFLLYWILSLISRILQLGIYRAMGVSFRQIIVMLTSEQVLTSGAAIVIGIITGNLTSRFFVPLFQMAFNPAQQVPPFEVAMLASDAIRLYSIVSIMVVLGLLILSFMTSRIKLHQAVKLGED